MSSMLVNRMKRELQILSRSTAPGITAWPRDEGSRMDVLDAEITGAPDTPYEGGIFRLEIHIPNEYPMKPPRVKFVTPIYHPNIDSQGRICLDSLNMPPKGAWKPSLNISTLLTTVQALMSSPNPDDGLMVDITDEFRRNPAVFRKKARQSTLKHAYPSTGNNSNISLQINDHVDDNDDGNEIQKDSKIEKQSLPQPSVVTNTHEPSAQPLVPTSSEPVNTKKSTETRSRPANQGQAQQAQAHILESDEFDDNGSDQITTGRLKKKQRR